MTYETAVSELENILQELQEGQVSIDALNEKVARAEVLIAWCKDKLRSTASQLEQLDHTNNHPTNA